MPKVIGGCSQCPWFYAQAIISSERPSGCAVICALAGRIIITTCGPDALTQDELRPEWCPLPEIGEDVLVQYAGHDD